MSRTKALASTNSFRATAMMATRPAWPRAFRAASIAFLRGQCRMAAIAACYRPIRTLRRPPRMCRCPRCVPLSSLQGANPTSAAMA